MSFNQYPHQGAYSQAPNPHQASNVPPAQSFANQPPVAQTTNVHRGRSWFWAGMAAIVLAAGAGIGGYAIAGGLDASPATVDAADDGTSGQGDTPSEADDSASPDADANTENDADTMTADDSADGATPVPGTAMTVEEANASVIRIEATGEFADPQFGLIEGVGSGSGFIISADGVAVTNNHVVAGAAFLEVFVPGEDRPRNARILATSECSDLAVIDIDGGGFPQVALNMADPAIGSAVYAAGYPLGDPEFTLTKGIVSKAETRGDTPFSSVDGVLEHDARINPGNSGGPLFDETGQVVGINYQGNPDTRQSFAITPANAQPIVDQMVNGVSVDSIGINGQVVDIGGQTFGIYISSVETGSMADGVGMLAGDVLVEIENIAVSTDGTMGDYCDVLRTNGTDVPLDVTVFRPDTNQILFGTLNDPNTLDVGFDGGEMMEDAGMQAPTEPVQMGGFEVVIDETESVAVEVPQAWNERSLSPVGETSAIPNIAASADLPGFIDGWTSGGIQLTAFDKATFDFEEVWDVRTSLTSQCNIVEPAEEVDLGLYVGVGLVAHECGPMGEASLVFIQVESADSIHFASGIIQVLTPEDVAAAERALITIEVA